MPRRTSRTQRDILPSQDVQYVEKPATLDYDNGATVTPTRKQRDASRAADRALDTAVQRSRHALPHDEIPGDW